MNAKILLFILTVLLISGIGFSTMGLIAPTASEDELASNFPYDWAGMSCYVKLDRELNVKTAAAAFEQLLDIGANYALGYLYVQDVNEKVRIHVYVDSSGYIICFLHKDLPAANLIIWNDLEFSKPLIADFTVTKAMATIAKALQVSSREIQENLKFFNFKYPQATDYAVSITTMSVGEESLQKVLHIAFPSSYVVHEASISSYMFFSNVDLDERNIWSVNTPIVRNTTAFDLRSNFQPTKPHSIRLTRTGGKDRQTGVAAVLIYSK